ncbi:MAG: tRNA 2-thiouridine(34) synthase MnmA [Proteobacteria bacterium]|nr:MAG: tRNA 2-thiouridine(34) synthase MnmA [Pseudomonadota bacterium]
MSGGVDSSVAAALLVEAGCEVIGVTLRLAGDASRCCSLDDAEDARRVAERLGIRFYVADYAAAFRREVMEPWADAYLAGRTPIPCVACNQRFKFRHLLERARALGAGVVATGHYARVERDATSGALRLRRGADAAKDQSYFLFDLGPEQLARIRFPVGALRKDEVRARARALGLATAEKPESQEICFVPGGDHAAVVEALRPGAAPGAGDVVDESGRVVGRHGGIHRLTVGQRRGLGIALGERVFVKSIDAAANRVTVAPAASLGARGARLSAVSWVAGRPPDGALRARVRVRHRHAGAEATVEPAAGGGARIAFDEAVTAVTPGQAAVFYDGDDVLGGGWIDEALA